jgi:hypothetical protein
MNSSDDDAPRRVPSATRGQKPPGETSYPQVTSAAHHERGPCSHRAPAPGHACEVCGHVAPRAELYLAVDPNGGPTWAFDRATGRWTEREVAA